jgi:hypothetical protein
VKPAEAAKRLNVGVGRIRTYCRIAGVEKRGCTYDIPEETLERWRMHPPGTALDYSSTVAGRSLKGQPIAGENYKPENDDVRLARAYRQLKLDLRIALAELSRTHQALAEIRKISGKTLSRYTDGLDLEAGECVTMCNAVLEVLAEIEDLA